MNEVKPTYIKVATNFARDIEQHKTHLIDWLTNNDNQTLTKNMRLVLQGLIETSEKRISATIEEITGLSGGEVSEAVNQLMELGVIEVDEVSE